MKRYALFVCEDFQAGGGWNDFRGSFDTLEQAKKAGKKKTKAVHAWFHVVDIVYGKIVMLD